MEMLKLENSELDKQIFLITVISLTTIISIESVHAEDITYYHNDVSGTPLLSTNSSGEVLWKENYRPYGDKLNNQAESQANQIGFHGKPYDNEIGLSYMQARYYNPTLGRFMGVDPVDYQEDNLHSFNRYAYANNNPYKYIDPNGLVADHQILKMVNQPQNKPITKKQLSETFGTIGTAADFISVGCAMTVVCAPAAPIIAGVGTGLGAASAVLDDDKNMLQKGASILLPAGAGKYGGKFVENIPEIGKGGTSAAYGLYADKTTSYGVDYMIENQNQNKKANGNIPAPPFKVDPQNMPVIPKNPYDFKDLR
jgi:RHS repeat-associated protein